MPHQHHALARWSLGSDRAIENASVDSLQQRFKIDGFPTLVVYDPASERAEQISGYGGPAQTRDWIQHNAAQVRWDLKKP